MKHKLLLFMTIGGAATVLNLAPAAASSPALAPPDNGVCAAPIDPPTTTEPPTTTTEAPTTTTEVLATDDSGLDTATIDSAPEQVAGEAATATLPVDPVEAVETSETTTVTPAGLHGGRVRAPDANRLSDGTYRLEFDVTFDARGNAKGDITDNGKVCRWQKVDFHNKLGRTTFVVTVFDKEIRNCTADIKIDNVESRNNYGYTRRARDDAFEFSFVFDRGTTNTFRVNIIFKCTEN